MSYLESALQVKLAVDQTELTSGRNCSRPEESLACTDSLARLKALDLLCAACRLRRSVKAHDKVNHIEDNGLCWQGYPVVIAHVYATLSRL